MTTIRPNLPPPLPAGPAQRPAEAGRLAAQKAFFAIAAGQAPAAGQSVQASPSTALAGPSAQLKSVASAGAEPPARVLRPGSLLDIRV